jgi:pyruvate dehydrogenase E1 component alpha subunit
LNSDVVSKLLFQMKRIRFVEETIAARYGEWKMRCPTHLSVGQEAVAAATGLVLRRDDVAVSGHRAHAHYLAKGGSLRAMIAEIYGKATGCARGKGGSMHLIDESAGFMGSTAIVAGTVPVGVGMAYALKLQGGDQVSCIFMGEAVTEAGVFYESVNFAALKKLPVLFVCENNLYSVYSPLHVRQPAERDTCRAMEAMGVKAQSGDGNDAVNVHEVLSRAVERIRGHGGPEFLEFKTYRWREHCGPMYDNDLGYRTEAEFLEWKARDPIAMLEANALRDGTVGRADTEDMQRAIEKETAEAFRFAEESPFPDAAEALSGVYASAKS